MAHTLASDKALALGEAEEQDISIIDAVQEQDIIRRRARLRLLQKGADAKTLNLSSSTVVARKRNRGWYVPSCISM